MRSASNLSNDSNLEPLQRVGRYDLFSQIGAGGMARVFLAVQHGPFDAHKLVVIKQLHERLTADADALSMFVNEAQIALRLNHRNVVHTYEVIAEASDYFLAMEFLDGQSLLHVVKRIGRQAMRLEQHLWILSEVLAGLHYAHELRDFSGNSLDIVHRDVSPSNVVVCYNGEVKLVDFGIAKALGALSETQDGVVKGKVGYAAPEQCLGKPSDRRADIYAVGVMLWEAMARRRRTQAETWPAMLHARLQNSEPPIEKVWPSAPPDLVAICRRALKLDPEQRYPTALEFQRDIERFLAKAGYEVGADALSALVAPRFAVERAQLHGIIEAHLARSSGPHAAAARAGAAGGVPSATKPAPAANIAPSQRRLLLHVDSKEGSGEEDTSPIPVSDALLLASKLDLPPSLEPVEPSSSMVRPRSIPPRRLWRWTLLGAGLTFGAALLFSVLRPRHEPPVPAAKPSAEGARAIPIGQGAPPGSQSAPLPSQVEVLIAVTPDTARLELDGKRLTGNPYAGRVERDDKEHELRVSADQYRTQRLVLKLDRNVDLHLALEPARNARTAPRVVRRGKLEPAASPAAPLSPPQRSAPQQQVQPGQDMRLPGGDRFKRTVDDKDPYAK
jgi:eukaryotic-like serine/threonine-protein kinase